MRFYEFMTPPLKHIKPMSADQARLYNLKNQVKRSKELLKAEKARQKIKAGQQQLIKMNKA